MPTEPFPLIDPQTRLEWRHWLEQHHAESSGVRLVVYKKDAAAKMGYLTYDDAVEEALCFGWVDGRTNSCDERAFLQQFTPRRKNSPWAKSNKERVERLIALGLMTPAGLQKIDEAKQSGAWDALADAENLVYPPDFSAALNSNSAARQNFEGFTISVRKMTLAWILSAKRPETRQKRIAQTVERAAQNKHIAM